MRCDVAWCRSRACAVKAVGWSAGPPSETGRLHNRDREAHFGRAGVEPAAKAGAVGRLLALAVGREDGGADSKIGKMQLDKLTTFVSFCQ